MVAWSVAEEIKLRENYPKMSIKELLKLFPSRTYRSVQSKARKMGLSKYNTGVKFVHNNGYVVVRYDDYPRDWGGAWIRRTTGIYVYEHCLEWYKHHPDMKIEGNEIIHHVDGNRANNDINNLMKMTRSQHARGTIMDEWEDIPGAEAMVFPF